MKNRGQSFLGGAAILMAAAFIVKVIGALFKIPLAAVLGGEGMGYYMTAYSFFNPVFALSAAGFPIAVSRLTAAASAQRRFDDKRRILNTALLLFSLSGLLLWAAVYIIAPLVLKAADNAPALKAVRCMAPAVFFCCVTSAFRGYYEGGRDMLPTAFSQVTEAVVKLILGLLLAKRCIDSALAEWEMSSCVFGFFAADKVDAMRIISPYAAAAAVSGVAFSTAAGSLVMLIFYLTREKEQRSFSCTLSRRKTALLLIETAFPVCMGAVVINLTSLVDLFSVMNRINLAAERDWYSFCQSCPQAMLHLLEKERAANFLYGSYTGLAMTVFNLVPALTAALGICALPMIASTAARGDMPLLRKRVQAVIKMTVIMAVPMGMGMSFFAEPILRVLFKDNPLETAVAARLLVPLGAAAVFVAITGAVNSMLQAMGEVFAPVVLLLIGAAIKLTANLLLISRPSVNILGAPIGTLFCYLFIALGGIHLLGRITGREIGLFAIMLKPVIAAFCCCVAAKSCLYRIENCFSDAISLLFSVMIGAAVYLILMVILGGITREELFFLKKGEKMQKSPL